MYKHLDSEYRNKWEEFVLEDGTVENSRLKNWRDVAWEKVVKIRAHLGDYTYVSDNSGQGFLAFMNFRWGGSNPAYNSKGEYTGHIPLDIWTIGWTDGKNCFLMDLDVPTGKLLKNYVAPLFQFVSHVHPNVRGIVFGDKYIKDLEVKLSNLEAEIQEQEYEKLETEYSNLSVLLQRRRALQQQIAIVKYSDAAKVGG